jgi:23S rRNA (pseudouridine1915-N3)-methyltransferase
MRLLVLAIGQRQPAWADAAWADFAKRFPPEMRLELQALMAAEAQRIEAAIPKGALRVVLDERGRSATTLHLAERLRQWLGAGRDVALLIGGPDGLDPALKAGADDTLRLSDLTLPHAFVRVLLAEALYRAWSLTQGHPYHRE